MLNGISYTCIGIYILRPALDLLLNSNYVFLLGGSHMLHYFRSDVLSSLTLCLHRQI